MNPSSQPFPGGGRPGPPGPPHPFDAATHAALTSLLQRPSPQTITYGALGVPAPSDDDLADLRGRQAAFADTTQDTELQNIWLAAPALAPPLIALGLEGAAAFAARAEGPQIARSALSLIDREPPMRVGDNWATRIGRRAHADFAAKIDAKPDWESNPTIPKSRLKPDAGTPLRGLDPANPAKRNYLELKPDTPTGRAAAARAVKRYKDASGSNVRATFYNPDDYK